MTKPKQSSDKKGAFSQLFNKSKQKIGEKKQVEQVLTQFAEKDLKRIAVVIEEWLKKDDTTEPRKATRLSKKHKVGRNTRL